MANGELGSMLTVLWCRRSQGSLGRAIHIPPAAGSFPRQGMVDGTLSFRLISQIGTPAERGAASGSQGQRGKGGKRGKLHYVWDWSSVSWALGTALFYTARSN